MARSKQRVRRKDPSENQKPFFEKRSIGPVHDQGFVQKKPLIGKANDQAEVEAENMAHQLTQVQKAEKKEEETPVQKAEKEEEKPVQKAEKQEEEKPVQKAEKEEEKPVQKAEKKEEEPPVQKTDKKGAPAAPRSERLMLSSMLPANVQSDSANAHFEKRLQERKGMGFQLPEDLRRDMEAKFKTSFTEVRIHNDKEAADMCEEIHAYAFAHGYDIYFNSGQYSPDSEAGEELLIHELTHVVQQNG